MNGLAAKGVTKKLVTTKLVAMKIVAMLGYLAYLVREVLAGSWRVARSALTPGPSPSPAIVEFPLRCRTDLQISALAASITITPGTLVVGTAEAAGDAPPTLFVHTLFAPDRESALTGLRDMETHLLQAAGGARAAGAADDGH